MSGLRDLGLREREKGKEQSAYIIQPIAPKIRARMIRMRKIAQPDMAVVLIGDWGVIA